MTTSHLDKIKHNKNVETIYYLKPLFIQLIHNRFGIVIHTHQTYDLIKTIQDACEKFNCKPDEYYELLKNLPNQSECVNHLVTGITVGETYFFRDQQQMALLKNNVLPQLIKRKRDQQSLTLRIWSAGCASGEEIYTIAMLLLELIPDIDQWTIKLLATDINTKSLQKAMTGVYSEWSMRSIPEQYKKTYFQQVKKNYTISSNIRECVTFDYVNLNEECYPSLFNGTNSQDLILCRNVLIYFDNDNSIKLIKRLNASLLLGGYLMLGASDPINIHDTDFIFHHEKGILFSRPLESTNPISTPVPPLPLISIEPQRKRIDPPKIIMPQKTKKSEVVVEQSLTEKAIDAANKGKLDEAKRLCEEGFKIDPTNKLNYFTHALTSLELNQLDDAEISFRKSIFLDNQFVVGHFQLGLLLLRKNQQVSGKKHIQNALTIAESKNPEALVEGSPQLCYQQLADILRNELHLYMAEGPNAH
jgi:chemotaxis protein methyltransferase CheR